MYTIRETYHDFNGNEITENFQFNFTEAEIVELQLTRYGGLETHLRRIIDTKDTPELIKELKEIVLKAYGKKSDDGKRFVKNDELRDAFMQTEAYSNIFMRLATNDEKAAEFINGIIPSKAKKPPIPALVD